MLRSEAIDSIRQSHINGAAQICDQGILIDKAKLSALAITAGRGGHGASDQLVLATCKYVDKIAQDLYLKWHKRLPCSCSYDEAFQAGVDGMLRAVKLYNPERGAFTTYMTDWVRTRVQRGAIYPYIGIMRIPEELIGGLEKHDNALSIGALSMDMETAFGENVGDNYAAPDEDESDARVLLDQLALVDRQLPALATLVAEGFTHQQAAQQLGIKVHNIARLFRDAQLALS